MDVNGGTKIEVATAAQAVAGGISSGDAAIVREIDNGVFLAIIDVLGHGIAAEPLKEEIVSFVTAHANEAILTVMAQLHERLRGTRGAAAGLCFITPDSGHVEYAGIGNTVIRRFGSCEQRLVSRDGVLGQSEREPRLETLDLSANDVLLLYTDGVRSHFELGEYPRLLSDGPQIIADTVIERFSKAHDDAACIVAKYGT